MWKIAPPNQLARSIWALYVKSQRDAAIKALATETDPQKRSALRAEADRYQMMLVTKEDTVDVA
jgi:hypothetical protein